MRALRARLERLTIRDAARIDRRLRKPAGAEALRKLAQQIDSAERLIADRAAAVPPITYPDLPVSDHRDALADAIRENQVVVVAGETGSGKTTQLPKICLELGRGVRGTIGHTQPRRLAARTVAERIAEELGVPLGGAVGYAVRFTDQVSDRTLVKLMTDGILLAEIQRDPRLLRYDTLILDEAHERSLNIDFLLGYLRQLLPRRPDLKLIVTSATIEPERFAAHLGSPSDPAPIVEVSGRTYPVEIRYRPLDVPVERDDSDDPDDPDHEVVRTEPRDQTEAVIDAVAELAAEPPGDVLVFLSGEREIRDTADALRGAFPDIDVLPLYARLATVEQQKVFTPNTSRLRRRVVLATNVAETSLTVPGIRYVVDPGTARISRYSRRTKVQRLPIEPISQASAAQRAGRSGRTAPGVCIRLYSQEDFEARPRYTDPEILRTNLAAVILQMSALRLGEIQNFPFLDPPDRRSVNDGIALLQELVAFDAEGTLTALGRRLAQLPVDPRLGRMILQADTEGCLGEVLVLAAALSIPDPRERPADAEEAARAKHARFADETSDFMSFLNLWEYLRGQRKALSGSAFRRMCRQEYLHYLRVREWQDLVGQLRGIAAGIGLRPGKESAGSADPNRIHAAVAAGLLSHVGLREGDAREYTGARNTRFVLSPGSVLTKRPPRWVIVADLVETSRLYGRVAARIDPESVERVAGHLVQRNHSEPHWDAARGEVLAFERATLYGLPLVARRRVGYAAIDPALAREMFIRHALVEGDWQPRHHFFAENTALRTEIAVLEERTRRRDLLAGDDEIYAFYDSRIPVDVVSARHFDGWWRKQRQRTPDLLTMTREDLLRVPDADTDRPERWQAGDLSLPLSYRFDPSAQDDGVTVHVPVGVLARLGGDDFSWNVPALREELVTALIRSLPKDLRRNFVPAPDTARAVLDVIEPGGEPLLEALQRALHRMTGVLVPIGAFDLDKLPAHLRVTFAVEAPDGAVVARGKDLGALQSALAEPARLAVSDAVAGDWQRTGLRSWPEDLEEVPRTVQRRVDGHSVRGYPGLVDAGAAVDIAVFATAAERDAAARPGLRRLLRLAIPSPVKKIEKQLDPRTRLLLASSPDGSLTALIEDCADAAVDTFLAGPVWTLTEFTALRESVTSGLPGATAEVSRAAADVLTVLHDVQAAIPSAPPPAQAEAVSDIRAQLDVLVRPGFVTATGASRLGDLSRYLTAVLRRLERLPTAPAADRERMDRVRAVQDAYDELRAALSPARAQGDDVADIARMIEEFRVSLWAQQLGTAFPVSEQRIYRAIDDVLAY